LQSEYASRLAKIEAERQTLAETVTAAERRSAEEKIKVDDFQQQLRSAKAAAESAKQELQDYKHKASRILQVRLVGGLKKTSLFMAVFFASRFIASKLFFIEPPVQREADQQSEGGIWSGHGGRQRGHGSRAGGPAS